MPPKTHIILPVFRPNEDYFKQQVASFKEQTAVQLKIYFVIADCQSGSISRKIAKSLKLDFEILSPEKNLDSVRAFQFGLNHLVKTKIEPIDYIALSDQDDIWHSNKLERNIEELERNGCDLVHSDARLIDGKNAVINQSLFNQENRVQTSDTRSLLYLNNITGMTSLFTARVLNLSVPFPKQAGVFFHHDLWLGLIASALSGVHFIDEQLVDYRQHDHNVIGALSSKKATKRLGSFEWRKAKFMEFYLANYLAKATYLRIEQSSDQSIHAAATANGGLRKLNPHLANISFGMHFLGDSIKYFAQGKPIPAYQAASFFMIKSARLGYCTFKSLRSGSFNLLYQMDALDRFGYSKSPGAQLDDRTAPSAPSGGVAKKWQDYLDPQRSLKFSPDFSKDAVPSINILVPTLNPNEIFAGIGTAIDFGCELASLGHHVRFISTDLQIASRESTRAFILNAIRNDMDKDTISRISLQCGVTSKVVSQSQNDMFFATAWWTAHAASEAIEKYGFKNKKFFYLIQDYEPNFYPWGSDYAGAVESYGFDVYPIFNTNILHDFFRNRGIKYERRNTVTFGPSINLTNYYQVKRQPQKVRRIALYGRPEVARNLFPTCVVATQRFIEAQKLTPKDVEVFSMGLKHEDIELSNGIKITSIGKLPLEDYISFLGTIDIGIALMLSPHPSHLPLEMAAAGVRVVTNHFENKNLSELSTLITSCDPTTAGVAKALDKLWNEKNFKTSATARKVALSKLGDPLSSSVKQISATLKKHHL